MVPEELQLNNKSQSMESKKVSIDADSSDESDFMDSDESDIAPVQVDSPGESQAVENEEADESGMSSEDGKEEGGVSSGWADAMKKILSVKKPPKKKTIVLAKAKRLSMMKLKQEEDEEDANKNVTDNLTEKKKEWTSKGREKPNVLQKDKEKALAKIATRGIVQLFNAVKDHKKVNPDKEEVSLAKKRPLAEMNKKQFLKMLMGEDKSEIKDEVEVVEDLEMKEEEDEEASKWEVLKDNFLMSTKLKNWDQTEKTSK